MKKVIFEKNKPIFADYWWLAESHLSGWILPFLSKILGMWWGPPNNISHFMKAGGVVRILKGCLIFNLITLVFSTQPWPPCVLVYLSYMYSYFHTLKPLHWSYICVEETKKIPTVQVSSGYSCLCLLVSVGSWHNRAVVYIGQLATQ